jgi:hypothetical protein
MQFSSRFDLSRSYTARVNHRPDGPETQLPVCPKQRTWLDRLGWSGWRQNRKSALSAHWRGNELRGTVAPVALGSLLNDGKMIADEPRWRNDQAGGSSRLAWNSAKYLANIASVSITSVKPACISLMVETIAGGPGLLRP